MFLRILTICLVLRIANGQGLRVAFQWKYLEWDKQSLDLSKKNFTLGNPLTQDVDIDKKGRVFVTSPQWLEGTPITLSVITNLEGSGGPMFTPYPDWSWHTPTCDSIVSVYRMAIDECNRLWVVDTGKVTGEVVCPSKILTFDLKTDKLINKYIIPAKQTLNGNASYVTPIIDIGKTCDDTHLYVADVQSHGLLVYNLKENRSWRINNTKGNAFGYDEEATNLTIAGEMFQLTDGTLGMSLSPKGFFESRYLYFNSLASFYQKFMDTDVLKRSDISDVTVYQSINKRISQAGAQAMSKTGVLFFQLAELTALACWNIDKPFIDDNIVILALDEENLQYISSMKVIENANGLEELWLNTNRLQKTINKSRKLEEVNFRLIRGMVHHLIHGTACEKSYQNLRQPNLDSWKKV